MKKSFILENIHPCTNVPIPFVKIKILCIYKITLNIKQYKTDSPSQGSATEIKNSDQSNFEFMISLDRRLEISFHPSGAGCPLLNTWEGEYFSEGVGGSGGTNPFLRFILEKIHLK